MLHRRGRFDGGVHVTNVAGICREGGWGGSGWLGMRSSALLEDAGGGSSREVISNVVLLWFVGLNATVSRGTESHFRLGIFLSIHRFLNYIDT